MHNARDYENGHLKYQTILAQNIIATCNPRENEPINILFSNTQNRK